MPDGATTVTGQAAAFAPGGSGVGASVPHPVPTPPGTGRGPGGYRPIDDYALIGDAQGAALVAGDGGVDWLCLPDFDSPPLLCRILDADRGGYLAIHPSAPTRRAQRSYRPSSAVLETTLELDQPEGGDGAWAPDGAAPALRLTDTLPVAMGDPSPLDGVWAGRPRHRLLRLVDAVGGPIEAVLEARLGFDFAVTPATVELVPGRGALVTDGGDRWLALVWHGTLEVVAPGEVRGTLTVRPGATAACVLDLSADEDEARAVLAAGPAGVRAPAGPDRLPRGVDGVGGDLLLDRAWAGQVEETDEAWRRWASAISVAGPYAEDLRRSAITLKLLTHERTGAIVAAPTTSLPETIGGVRNWDYRYCWLRDATFTLYALLLLGDRTAADNFWGWVERTCAGEPPERLQIMYGVRGERELTERELGHLSGYRDSRPVRVGNGAFDQRQTDVYGELLDAFWFYYCRTTAPDATPRIRGDVWELMRATADYICAVWREPDQGLWEIRGAPLHHVYSKVMCWVGLDRAIRMATRVTLPCDLDRWRAERDAIRTEILERGFNPRVGAFTMAYGVDALDASALRMPLVGFLPADDPRMRATIDSIQADLSVDGLVLRYRAEDNLPGAEGAFSICTFWLIDCLTALGRIDEAKVLFDRMLGYANDLGLFAEQVDPATGAALGNFPQAFTHLALIDAGVDLTAALARRAAVAGGMTERASTVAEAPAPSGGN
ncbi:MAG: Glucoamylase [uncultured Thermomicrobiales bacterium]|uniref:Glucoamylase n=1 Tax=uncultured Thermomicrobiales bacterium TaxID=1645740 RepID=A0A6J4V7R9_9BACT|nr:MAG: Glucoamylase [uncultured Thermomicrobiales bacterium]